MTQTIGPQPEAILFDMDGTLLQTETLLIPVHERLFTQLRKEGLYSEQSPPVEIMLGCLGMLLEDIWQKIMPNASIETHRRADELMLQYELEGLDAGQGDLYPGVEETLRELHAKGIKLFVASNGLEDYVRGISKVKQLDSLFDGLYSAGQYETATKVDLVARLMQDHNLQTAWMVGDRSSDVEAGKKNGLPVIGCQYAGFGREEELSGADTLISAFPELLNLLPSE